MVVLEVIPRTPTFNILNPPPSKNKNKKQKNQTYDNFKNKLNFSIFFCMQEKNTKYKCALNEKKCSDTYALDILDYIDASALEGRELSNLSTNEDSATKLTKILAHEIDIFFESM